MITIIKNLLRKSTESFSSNHAKFLSSANESRQVSENQQSTKTTPPRYQLHPRLEIRQDGDTRVLIDNRNGSITSCNKTAWSILSSLLNGTTRDQITETLCQEFHVSCEQAETDISSFFNHLNSMGCLQEVD